MNTDKIHIPTWGTFVTTPVVTKEYASISLTMDIEGRIIAKISEWKLLSLIHKEKEVAKASNVFVPEDRSLHKISL